MPITVTKKKVETPVKEVEQEVAVLTVDKMTDEQLADHYGTLQDQATALMTNPVFNNLKLAEEELQKRVNDQVEPTDGAEIIGSMWALEIAAAAKNARKITDMGKIAVFLGTATFAKIAKVTIGDAEKNLTPEQFAQVVTEDTGYAPKRKIVAKFLGNKG